MNILEGILHRRSQGKKSIAVLIDPDKARDHIRLLRLAQENCTDLIMVGGSLIGSRSISDLVKSIKKEVSIPVVLFPGHPLHIAPGADGILFLSLISGRNPEFLIGNHVHAAPLLRQSGMEILPTGYMLVNSGKLTSAAYMSNTMPIPDDKPGLAAITAMAGEMLGLRLIYLDAGSGAEEPVPRQIIAAVREAVNVPLIVGGGIKTPEMAYDALEAGADMLVIGNVLEKDPGMLTAIADRLYGWNKENRISR